MYSEKKKLLNKRENPFYGSYKEQSVLEEIHWQNRKKKRQLGIVSGVICVLVILAIGITLAITLPDLFSSGLDPPNPNSLPPPSKSLLQQYSSAGISSESSICSDIGRNILENLNGTAVDAAVAVALCLGVTSPQSGGIGGGLFMVIYSGGQMYSLNARETAPTDSDITLYETDPLSAFKGGLAVGVPGELAGLWAAHQRFGQVNWDLLVRPARELAQNGFNVEQQLANSLEKFSTTIREDPVLSSEFINPATDSLWKVGELLVRSKLGVTLEQIERDGLNAFYGNGTLAETIVDEIQGAGGIISLDDLLGYSVSWDEPIMYELNNTLTLFGSPFPSSAPLIALALGILDGFSRRESKTSQEIGEDAHNLAEALKFASAHRGQVADPLFVTGNLTTLMDKLLSVEYAEELRSKIMPFKTFHDPVYYGATFSAPKDSGTAHISILGPNDEAVSLTTTINFGFGAGFMGNATGIIYNNEIGDFSFPNLTDAYGLPHNPNNLIEPGKRPSSSMSPLIFLNENNKPVLATGAAGGVSIIPALITATWRALYRHMDIKKAIDFPRFMPNFSPSELVYEFGLSAPIIEDLQRRGHKMRRLGNESHVGNVNSVCLTKQSEIILANADWRKNGESAGF